MQVKAACGVEEPRLTFGGTALDTWSSGGGRWITGVFSGGLRREAQSPWTGFLVSRAGPDWGEGTLQEVACTGVWHGGMVPNGLGRQ